MTRVSTSNIQCDGFPATFPNDSPEGCPQDRVVEEFITNFGEEGWSSLVIEDGVARLMASRLSSTSVRHVQPMAFLVSGCSRLGRLSKLK